MSSYDDIIHLPHPTSPRHPRMTMLDRAAQFSPFAALTGYEAVIEETGRLTQRQIFLDENEKYILDCKQRLLLEWTRNSTVSTHSGEAAPSPFGRDGSAIGADGEGFPPPPSAPEVTVCYYVPDERKDGGAYVHVSGQIKKIDAHARILHLTDGTAIELDKIIDLDSPLFRMQ